MSSRNFNKTQYKKYIQLEEEYMEKEEQDPTIEGYECSKCGGEGYVLNTDDGLLKRKSSHLSYYKDYHDSIEQVCPKCKGTGHKEPNR